MASFEELFHKNGFSQIAGVDEAGRGPLAGPVVASAVMFPRFSPVFSSTEEIRDSKSLTPKMREAKYWEIISTARVGVGIVSETEIDEINILRASLRAMRKALLSLTATPDLVLIDGISFVENLPLEQLPIVDGDRKVISIAAASIVAKVTRDKIMENYDRLFPQYGFSKHKGYPTPEHLKLLDQHGPSPIHRVSFGPVSRCFDKFDINS